MRPMTHCQMSRKRLGMTNLALTIQWVVLEVQALAALEVVASVALAALKIFSPPSLEGVPEGILMVHGRDRM